MNQIQNLQGTRTRSGLAHRNQDILAGLSNNRSSLETGLAPVTTNVKDGSRESTQELNRNLLLEMRQATAAIAGLIKNVPQVQGKNLITSFLLIRIRNLACIGSALLLKSLVKDDQISLWADSQSSLVQNDPALELGPSTNTEVCPPANIRPMPGHALSDINLSSLFEESKRMIRLTTLTSKLRFLIFRQ